MPYLCDVKNKLNSITMKYKSRSIAKVIVPVFLVVSLFAFTTHTTEQPEGTPLFITGITPYNRISEGRSEGFYLFIRL